MVELIRIIKTGSPPEVKAAQKQVEKIWHRACVDKLLRKEFSVFMQEARQFDDIHDILHKTYFINTLKWPLWESELADFPFWADFLLRQVQSPEGKIRIAAVRVGEYLLMAVDRHFDRTGDSRDPEKARIALNYYGRWVMCVEELLGKYHERRFNRCKYIDAIPPSVYKSLQQMHQVLLPSGFYEDIYRKFRSSLENSYGLNGFGRA